MSYEFDDFDTQIQIEEVIPMEYDFDDAEFDEPFDSFDDADALASAGFGTDEDYNHFSSDDY